MTKVVLCGKPGRCCPVLDKQPDKVTITDDYGGKVTLTKEQAKLLKREL